MFLNNKKKRLDFQNTPFRNIYRKKTCVGVFLTLSAPRETYCVPPCRFFDRCILTDRALKLILHDFSPNFILNMWPVKFFWSGKYIVHTGLFAGDRQRLSLIMELAIHCYTALVLEIGHKFGYLIATYIVTVYNATFFYCVQCNICRFQLNNSPLFPQPMNRFVVMLQTSLLATHNIGWGIN